MNRDPSVQPRPDRPDSFLPPVPSVRIMGVRVHQFTLPLLHACMAAAVRGGRRVIIANVNAHALNIAAEQDWFRDFLNNADFVFCDGYGAMLAARLLGLRLPARITYAAWMPVLAQFCAREGFSMFLLGGRPGIAASAAERLCREAPALRVAGVHDGYFDQSPASPANIRVREILNAASPDILLTAFGMPLQERWLRDNWPELNARIALPGGGALDYAAGRVARPPPSLTEHGLEWLGRLLIEPRRLWRRYLLGNPRFLWRVLKERCRAGER